MCIAAAAYVTNVLIREGKGLDVPAIVLIGLAGFFGLFAFTMASLSLRFACVNSTNIENLRGNNKVYQLAIRIPLNQTPNSDKSSSVHNNGSTNDYETITFPLADPNFDGNRFIYGNQNASPKANGANGLARPAAEHKFAIVKTDMGDNPWDTGSYYENFKSVMGDKGLPDWLLPLRLSPCFSYNCVYPVGPVVDKLRERLQQ